MTCVQKLPSKNGRNKISKLFPDLVAYYHGDQEKALEKFSEIFSDDFKRSYGDWQNNKIAGAYNYTFEPPLDVVVGRSYSLENGTPEQRNTYNKISALSVNMMFNEKVDGEVVRYANKNNNKVYYGTNDFLQNKGVKEFGVPQLNWNEQEVKKNKLTKGIEQIVQEVSNKNIAEEAKASQTTAKIEELKAQIEAEHTRYPLIAEAGTAAHEVFERVLQYGGATTVYGTIVEGNLNTTATIYAPPDDQNPKGRETTQSLQITDIRVLETGNYRIKADNIRYQKSYDFETDADGKILHYHTKEGIGTPENDSIDLSGITVRKNIEKAVEDIAADLPSEVTDKIQNPKEVIRKALAIKNTILKNYEGQNVEILTEQILSYDGEKYALAGTADVIVIREDGTADLYDWKTSSKELAKWSNFKNISVNYQLAIYKAMLEAQGIKVNRVKVLPAEISIDDNGSIESLDFDSITELPLTNNSTYMMNVRKVIPYKSKFEAIPIKDNVILNETLEKMFNEVPRHKRASITDADVEDFIERMKGRVTDNEIVSVKGNKPVSLDDKKAVKEHLIALEEERLQLANNTWSYIESARTAREGKTVKLGNRSVGNRKAALDKYVTEATIDEDNVKDFHWIRLDIPAAEELGILLLQNKKTGVVDIISTTPNSLDAPREMTFGDSGKGGNSIAGNYLPPRKESSSTGIRPIQATEANFAALKTIAFVLSNNNVFDKDTQIGNVSVISSYNSEIPYGVEFAPYVKQLQFVTELSEINNEVTDKIKQAKPDQYKQDYIKSLLGFYENIFNNDVYGRIKPSTNKTNYRYNIVDLFKLINESKTYSKTVEEALQARQNELLEMRNFQREVSWNINKELDLISSILNDKRGLDVSLTTDLKVIGSIFGENSSITQPDEITKKPVQAVIQLLRHAQNEMRLRYSEVTQRTNPAFESLYKRKTNIAQRVLKGNKDIYKNLMEYKLNKTTGKWMPTFKWRDPSSNQIAPFQTKLTKEEINFMNTIQNEIQQVRALNGIELDRRAIPLMRASSQSKALQAIENFRGKSVGESLSEALNDIVNPSNAFSKERSQWLEAAKKQTEMFDSFAAYETEQGRKRVLNENDITNFEDDLELVFNAYMINHIRTQENAKVLSPINAVKASVMVSELRLHRSFPEIVKYIEMLVEGDVYGKMFTSEEQGKLMKFTKPLQQVVSIGAIGLSPSTSFVNTLTNLWQTTSAIAGVASDRVSPKSFMKAFTFVSRHAASSMKNVSLINYLNQEYGFHEMESARLQSTLRRDKFGYKNFESAMHFLNAAPDYIFRTALFIAEAIEEGTMVINNGKIANNSAINWDEKNKRIVYKQEYDKRFSELFKSNPDTKSEKYLRQKALYEGLMEDLKKEHQGVTYDEKREKYTLNRAYASRDIESKKKISNLIYAESSTTNKTWLERTALGSMALMFKRWMLSKKTLYYREYVSAEDNLIAGKRTTYQDPETGEWKSVWEGRPMEGIFQSLIFAGKELAETKNAFKTWNNLQDYQKRNLKHLGMDLAQWAIITLLASILISDDKDEKKKLEQQLLRILDYSGRDLLILNTWSSITGENNSFMAVSYVNTFIGDMFESLYDGAVNQEFSPGFLRRIGLVRNVQDYLITPLTD